MRMWTAGLLAALAVAGCGTQTPGFDCPEPPAGGAGSITVRALDGLQSTAGSAVHADAQFTCEALRRNDGTPYFGCWRAVNAAGNQLSRSTFTFNSDVSTMPAGTVLHSQRDFDAVLRADYTSEGGAPTDVPFFPTDAEVTITLGPVGTPRTATLNGRVCRAEATAQYNTVPLALP